MSKKITANQILGEIGENAVKGRFLTMGFQFDGRSRLEAGIDGIAEVMDRGQPLAKMIAVQVKAKEDGRYASETDEGFAQDIGEEAGRCLVGLAGANADGRQADADAVEEAAAGIIGQEQFADRLVEVLAAGDRLLELLPVRLDEGAGGVPVARRRRRGPRALSRTGAGGTAS